ncbi:MAG: hypothetical protein ABIJ16_00490 [Bacteroidota bacterium]
MRFLIIYIISSILAAGAFSQKDSMIRMETGFAEHLMHIGFYDDAIHVLGTVNPVSPLLADTVSYLKGWSYYNLKQLDSASFWLGNVGTTSAFFEKSLFFNSFCRIAAGEYSDASLLLSSYKPSSTTYLELARYQQAGISLLTRNINSFDSLSSSFTYNYYPVTDGEKNFVQYGNEIRIFKPRSMFLAGMFSTCVPGLGKLYAGKPGEAAAAFLMVSALGLVTWENYRKDGPADPKTIIFGGMFTVFYIGNIWGSVFSIKFRRDEFNNETNHKILLDLHIPLRTIFN